MIRGKAAVFEKANAVGPAPQRSRRQNRPQAPFRAALLQRREQSDERGRQKHGIRDAVQHGPFPAHGAGSAGHRAVQHVRDARQRIQDIKSRRQGRGPSQRKRQENAARRQNVCGTRHQ
ncbi:hypothetical protein SDC9_102261 [bioreactor metagenome]|uniref:Uncharacterized protein n=1 Tax=bioreactor metagenome TaxID=1076179 RepID=A0A645B153_9ZZZZ